MSYLKNCPCCGDGLKLCGETDKVRCPSCERVFTAGEIAIQTLEEENGLLTESCPGSTQADGCICRNCSAQIVAYGDESTAYCSFCGAPAIKQTKLSEVETPDSVVPFAVDRSQAKSAFVRHFRAKPLADFELTVAARSGKLNGIYMPCRVISCEMETRAFMAVGENKVKYRCIKTEYESEPLSACSHFDRELLDFLSPFDLKSAREYSPEQMQGYSAAKQTLSYIDSARLVIEAAKEQAMKKLHGTEYGSEDEFTKLTSCTHICNSISSKTVLLPVWVLSCEKNGRTTRMFMNGQTGKIIGMTRPSLKKSVLYFGAASAVAALLGEIIRMVVR